MTAHCRRIAGTALILSLACTRAQAQPARIDLQVVGAGCPDAALLEQKLAPLLGRDAALEFDTDGGNAPARAVVDDRGDRYTIAVGELQREIADAARDCVERARVAAVFIALNVRASPAPAEPEPEPEAQEPPPSPEEQAGMRLGLRVLGEAGYAAPIERGVVGASAGAWLGEGAFVLAVTAGALSTADVDLAARDGVAGAVELTRFPLSASASYLLRAGPLAFGPAFGLCADLLHLRGAGVPEPQTELRLNPGALAGADLHARFTPAVAGVLRVAVHAFPRAYDLSVDPAGRLARTPRLWLSAQLGVDVGLH